MVLTVLLTLVPLVVVALLLVAFYKRQLPRQLRWYSDTGLPEWRRKAAQLPWRDRYLLYRANVDGRPVERRLAALAVERGRVMLRVQTRTHERGSDWRRMRIIMVLVTGLNVVLFFVLATRPTGGRYAWLFAWLMLGMWLLLLGLSAAEPALTRRVRRKIERSVALNQAVVDESQD